MTLEPVLSEGCLSWDLVTVLGSGFSFPESQMRMYVDLLT